MRDVIWFERLKPLTYCDFKGVDKPSSTEMFKTMCQGMHQPPDFKDLKGI